MAFRNAPLLTAGMQIDPILAPMSIRSILGRLSPRMRNTDSSLSKSYGSLYTYTCLPIILSDEEITNVSARPALKSKVFGLAMSKFILLSSFKSKKGSWPTTLSAGNSKSYIIREMVTNVGNRIKLSLRRGVGRPAAGNAFISSALKLLAGRGSMLNYHAFQIQSRRELANAHAAPVLHCPNRA